MGFHAIPPPQSGFLPRLFQGCFCSFVCRPTCRCSAGHPNRDFVTQHREGPRFANCCGRVCASASRCALCPSANGGRLALCRTCSPARSSRGGGWGGGWSCPCPIPRRAIRIALSMPLSSVFGPGTTHDGTPGPAPTAPCVFPFSQGQKHVNVSSEPGLQKAFCSACSSLVYLRSTAAEGKGQRVPSSHLQVARPDTSRPSVPDTQRNRSIVFEGGW